MIVPGKQGENCHVLNVENADQGQGEITLMHFTDPAGNERVEVHIRIYDNTTANWLIRRIVTPA